MPSQITHQQYGQAVLEHVQTGVYPESEAIISADLPPSVLPDISELIEHAQDEVKVSPATRQTCEFMMTPLYLD